MKSFHYTYQYRFAYIDQIQNLKSTNFILAIWHQNLFAGILAQTGKSHIVIISKSRDADPVAYVCRKLGHKMVRGSSTKGNVDKGGKLAKDGMIDLLKQGFPGAITVDGPKGPAFVVKPGIIDMAKKSESMIVPYSLSYSSFWEFKSWDRFRLPKPFAKILISYGAPIDVSNEEIFFADHLVAVETALKNQTHTTALEIEHWEKYSKKNWFS